jgi:hypothetical protein
VDEVPGNALANKHALRPGMQVFIGAAARDCFPCRTVPGLHAFPQTDRIIRKRDEAFYREIRCHPVVLGLTKRRVAGGHEHCRMPSRSIRAIEIGGDVEFWQALEDDFLHRVMRVLQPAEYPRVQRPPVFR